MIKHRIFRCLDKPSSFFGIKGRFGKWGVIALLLAGVISIIIGSGTTSLLGFLAFMVLCAFVYFAILSVQRRVNDRQMSKIIASRNRVSHIKVSPVNMKSLFQFYS